MSADAASGLIDRYLDTVGAQLERLRATQGPALDRAAGLLADAVAGGGIVHLFGTGHSHLLAEEVFWRAGGLVAVDAMLDPSILLSAGALQSTVTERQSGTAAAIAARYDLRPGDAGVVISHSGRNAAPVEMAQLMRSRGLAVVGVTSVAQATAAPPHDPPGRCLPEVCDVVLDTGAAIGDAALRVPGVLHPVGPTSTVVGAALLHCLVLATIGRLAARGGPVVNLPSANVDDADLAPVLAELARLRERIRHL